MEEKYSNSSTLDAAFAALVVDTVRRLNFDAKERPNLFGKQGGKQLEPIVYRTMCSCAKGTLFESHDGEKIIRLVSGQKFPDIVVAGRYGVEVKSTESDKWQSIGSSINESTRVYGVEEVYMLFGKLGGRVEFCAKRYQDCLDEIVVTHYPRYRIDMKIQENGGKTIFEKMGVDYDVLRHQDEPVPLVAKYYKGQLLPGQKLWWASDSKEDSASPLTIRMWNTVPAYEKEELIAKGFVYFPQVCGTQIDKYSDFLLWLATEQSVICGNVRDLFTAGGRERFTDEFGNDYTLGGVYRHLMTHRKQIKKILETAESQELALHWKSSKPVAENYAERLQCWEEKVYNEVLHDDSELTFDVFSLILRNLLSTEADEV